MVVLLAVTASVQGSAAEAAAASVGALVSGAYAVPFWLGFVGIGLVLPFCLELLGRRKAGAGEAAGSSKALAIAGELGVLVGGFMLRYLVIMAALPVVLA